MHKKLGLVIGGGALIAPFLAWMLLSAPTVISTRTQAGVESR
jgi:hypothetical protein